MTFRMQGNARHSKESMSSKKKSLGDLKARRIQNVGSQSFSYILHNLAFVASLYLETKCIVLK